MVCFEYKQFYNKTLLYIIIPKKIYWKSGKKMQIKLNTIIVENIEKTTKFYTENLEFKIHSNYNLPNNTKITLLKGKGETMIELIQSPNFPVGFYSIGMEVENLKETVEKLKQKGLKFLMEPTKISVGEMARLQDPNGINIVLIHHNLK
jgi:lactoylglutathione lyase